jgi:hypothetical protein
MTAFTFVLLALAIYRVIRLWLDDTITMRLHDAVMSRITNNGLAFSGWRWWLSELLSCQWCLGIWAGFATAIAYGLWADTLTVPGVLVVGLALAAAQSIIHVVMGAFDPDDD